MTSIESKAGSPPTVKPKRFRQIGLSTLLLATACAAVWYSVWITRHRIAQANDKLAIGRPLMRELVLKDRDHLSAVALDQVMYDEYGWQVFLPGEGYQLQIATTGIDAKSRNGIAGVPPTAEQSVPLSPGQHLIQLESYLQGEEWWIQVQVDLEPVILVKRPKEWNASSGSFGGSRLDRQEDHPPETKLDLFRRVFTKLTPPTGGPMSPNDDGNGIQLWIEGLGKLIDTPSPSPK